MNHEYVTIIGAGLAGVEAAYQLASRGIPVKLYEMKKHKKSPAHTSDDFAELVCSNSLRSNDLHNAVGLLKEEMRRLNSIVMSVADKVSVPAGSALAVDRIQFSKELTSLIRSHPLITVIDEEVTELPSTPTIIATGPLTSEALFNSLQKLTCEDYLYFFDAAAPIVTFESIDMTKAYFKSRYDKGEPTYINCPMTKEEYDIWYEQLLKAECVIPHDFELKLFEGCMPFEEMARRGEHTLRYGPLKPVGLEKEKGKRPYAVVQLRQDNQEGTLYNIVGFQTHLTFPEQRKIIRLIPGLENAEIVRYGVMHRNSFVNAPRVLNRYYQMKDHPNYFIAGQLSGVEGYVESAGSGLIAGIQMARYLSNKPFIEFPQTTALGAQSLYFETSDVATFQPMNINFGLFLPLDKATTKKDKKSAFVERSLEKINEIKERDLID